MWKALLLNVVGGILAGLAFSAWRVFSRTFAKYRFKQIFGQKAAVEGISLVYEEFVLRNQAERYAYCKPGQETSPRVFSVTRPIPITTVRSISYLSSAIGKAIGQTPAVRSERDVCNMMDFDYVSFGGPFSNVMTETALANSGNRLVEFDQKEFRRKSDGKPIIQLKPSFDYGLILKIHPAQFPERVWIACAGIGERGTSGAAWYLANKWQELRRRTSGSSFAAIVKVEPDVQTGRDQSAELLALLIQKETKIENIVFENACVLL